MSVSGTPPTPPKIDDPEAWLAELDLILRAADALVNNVSVERCSGAQVAALALLARSTNQVRAVSVLVRAGHVVEARVIARCLVENLFLATALKEDPAGTVKKLEADHHQSRRARGTKILKNARAFSGAQREQVREEIKRMEAELAKPRFLTPSDLAASTSAGEAYHVYAQLSADSAHASIDALERHVIKDPEGELSGICVEPELASDEEAETLGWGCMAMLHIILAIRDLAGAAGANLEIEAAREGYFAIVHPSADLNEDKDSAHQ